MLDLFIVCSNYAPLDYSGSESKNKFVVFDSDIPVTLKLGKGRQTCNKLLDSEQSYNHEKFGRPPLNSVPPKSQKKSPPKKDEKRVKYLP